MYMLYTVWIACISNVSEWEIHILKKFRDCLNFLEAEIVKFLLHRFTGHLILEKSRTHIIITEM